MNDRNDRNSDKTIEVFDKNPSKTEKALHYIEKALNLQLLHDKDSDFYNHIMKNPIDYQHKLKILIENFPKQELSTIYEGTIFEGYANPSNTHPEYIELKKLPPSNKKPWSNQAKKSTPLSHNIANKAFFSGSGGDQYRHYLMNKLSTLKKALDQLTLNEDYGRTSLLIEIDEVKRKLVICNKNYKHYQRIISLQKKIETEINTPSKNETSETLRR